MSVQGSVSNANGDSARQPRSIEATLQGVGSSRAATVAAAIRLMPICVGLTLPGQKAPALFGGIFVPYVTEALPLAISSLLDAPAAALIGVDPIRHEVP